MLSLEQSRKIEPELDKFTDDEVIKIKDSLYELGNLIFDVWRQEKYGSKNPVGVLPESVNDSNIKP